MTFKTPTEYILKAFENKSPEDIIRYVRARKTGDSPKYQGSLDVAVAIIRRSKKEAVVVPFNIYMKDDSGKITSPDTATDLELKVHYSLNAITFPLSKKEMQELIESKDKQMEMLNSYFTSDKWKIIQDPWDPNNTPPQDIPVTTTTTTSATTVGTQSGTQSSPTKIDSEFTFNVEKDKTFQIVGDKMNIGELIIVRKEDPNNPVFLPPSEGTEEELDEEYSEASYAGPEEDPEILKGVEESESGMPPGNFSANVSESDVNSGKSNSVDSVVKKTTAKIKPGKEFGSVSKTMADADILDAMVRFIEGGYFSPAHVSKFNPKSQALYKNSGETLWGIDRCAGQTEKEEVGRKFWSAVDSISGYGDIGSYSRNTKSGEWDIARYPIRANAWKYGYIPKTSDKGYDIMYSCFVDYAVSHLNSWLNSYFSTHPELKKMILSDARFKFMWFRSTWNGIGWFKWYANGKGKAHGLKWAYDNVSKDLETLIKWDLNNRLAIANGNALIVHDVSKISSIIGIKDLS